MNRDKQGAEVIVVGAGPAGAALALLLARSGIDTLLLERHADFEREFRGEGVQPSGFECFEQIGIADAIAELPQTRLRQTTFGVAGRIVDMPIDQSDLEGIRMISQPALLARLCELAAAYPCFHLRMGEGVRELLRDEQGRVIGVRVASGEQLHADYVVAGDGRHSVVRKRLGIELELLEQSFDVLWTRARLDGPLVGPGRTHVELLPRGGFAALFPSPTGGQQIGVIIRKGSYRELRRDERFARLEWLRGEVSEEFASTIARAGDLHEPILLDVICGRATTWSAPGVLLIGDAAHPMSPVGGQGINMALRDAVVAANHLVPVLRRANELPANQLAECLDAAARAIEVERLPEIIPIQALQTKRAKAFDRRHGRLSLWMIQAIVRLRPLARLLMRQRAPFGQGQTKVELQI